MRDDSMSIASRGCRRALRAKLARSAGFALVFGMGVSLAASAGAQQAEPASKPAASASEAAAPASSKPAAPAPEAAVPGPRLELEPKAMEVLKAACDRLAAAHTMKFTAVVSYESPSRFGPALVYTTHDEVAMQRPDKLRVLSPGDGPASDFYYDGKSMVAYSPGPKLVAVAAAPPTIGAMLQKAYDSAQIYYPFTDLIVADPYKDLTRNLLAAFYIGQSHNVGGTTTDMLGLVYDDVFIQVWIGAEDKLPRRARAVYREDPLRLRHDMELSDWQLDAPIAADVFAAPSAAMAAHRIAFATPQKAAGAIKPSKASAIK
jgi:hypothetical protein